jgi:hypothetical protein
VTGESGEDVWRLSPQHQADQADDRPVDQADLGAAAGLDAWSRSRLDPRKLAGLRTKSFVN